MDKEAKLTAKDVHWRGGCCLPRGSGEAGSAMLYPLQIQSKAEVLSRHLLPSLWAGLPAWWLLSALMLFPV